MSPDSALFQAILAMDAYNRIGNDVTFRNLAVDDTITSIGNVTIAAAKGVNSSGFFAQSYVVQGTGQKIISYRGTDIATFGELSKDAFFGWRMGAGDYSAAQAELAAQFFQQIVGGTNQTLGDLYNANVLLTGHSLGGGLAGLVASIYHQSGIRIFDSMDFTVAAQRLLNAVKVIEHFDESGNSLGFSPTDVAARALFFLNGEPTYLSSPSQINYSVQGQGLSELSGLPVASWGGVPGSLNQPEYSLGFDGLLSQVQRHSSALAVLLTYAGQTGVESDWRKSSRYWLTKLFENPIAQLLGLQDQGLTGVAAASDKLLAMIAYSAIDDGVTLYGNTGIRALFDDGNDFGRALALSNVSKTLTGAAEAIGKIVAQYAGQLAVDKVSRGDHQEALAGVISLASNQLIIDLDKNRWTSTSNQAAKVLGRDDLLNDIRTTNGLSDAEFTDALSRLWQDPKGEKIDRIIFLTTEEPFSGVVSNRPQVAAQDGVTLFIASGQGDTIAGTLLSDAIYGGDGNDSISGSGGADLLVGGDGEDVLDGGDGNDLLIGGAKSDILKGGVGNDELWGGDQADKLWGGTGNDLIRGGAASDIIYADAGNDLIYGELGTDTYQYKGDADVTGGPNAWEESGLSLTLGNVSTTNLTGQAVTGATLIGEATGADVLDGIDIVELTDNSDTLKVQNGYQNITEQILFDMLGQSSGGGDVLDLSALTGVNVGSQSTKVTLGNLTFTNFEKVVGSAGNDRIGLNVFNPFGSLTTQEQQSIKALLEATYSFGRDPSALAQAERARLEQARLIPENQKTFTIDGGGGNDVIVGSETGVNIIDGGEGDDYLVAGGFSSIIHGGAGSDVVVGGGFGSELYGDSGSDLFGLADNSFVKDATAEDYASWGSFVLTGGVQQYWMEDGWAYYAPLSSLLSGAPLGFLDVFGYLALTLDVPAMTTVRYAMTDSNQLIVQFARGRGGQAVIDNYNLDLDTGAATAHIVAFRQILAHGTLDDFKRYLNLALLAGFGGEPAGTDPLVLDLDGDGLELTRPDAGNVYFDVDHDGFAERTAWVGGDDGFLARDLNGNGIIDDSSELFGDNSHSGFAALGTLDSNHDGKINAADAAFSTLRVWRDLNGNGVTDAGELKTLAETGIVEISLTTSTPAHGSVRGNTVTAEATFTRSDGTTSVIGDTILQNNQIDSKYLGDTTVSAAAAALPNLKGFGILTDLAVAMSHDATLLAAVAALKALPVSTSWSTLRADAQAILFRWAGVDGVTATPMGGGTFDTQRLALLEHYMGQQLAPRDGNGQPTDANVAELITSWNSVLDKATIRLAVQGPLHAIFGDIAYDLAGDQFVSPGPTTLSDAYRAAIAQLSANAATALADWNANWAPALVAYGNALVRQQGQQILADYEVQGLVRALDGTSPSLTLAQLVAGLGLTGVTVGTTGNDTLARGTATGSKVYAAGAGNDTITGGTGQDVYVFGRDFGQDDVFESEYGVTGDRIRLALYNPDDVTIAREGVDLVIRVKGTTDKITVHGQFTAPMLLLTGQVMTPDQAIEEIQFADGTIYEAGDIAAAIGLGTDGNDIIDGSAFADELEGLKGDDLLRGGDAGDSYYYTRGDGNDTIQDVMTNPAIHATDTLFLFGGITTSDVRLVRNADSNDLTIYFGWAGDSITLKDQFTYSALGYGTQLALDNRIESILFYGGAGWSWRDIQVNTLVASFTDGNDASYGFGTGDQFYASAGDDLLVGYDGGDTYRFGYASGHDTIYDQQRYPETFISGLIGYGWGDDDVLEFASGITPGNVTFQRTGAAPDLLITLAGSTDTMTIKNQFVGQVLDIFGLLGMAWFNRVEKFKFSDGTIMTWEDIEHIVTTGTSANDNLYGAFYPDVIDGHGGSDYLSGGDDGDTYVFNRGYGHATIEDQQVSILNDNSDSVQFGAGITAADLTFTRIGNSNDLQVSVANSTDTLTVSGQFLYYYNIFDTQPDRIEFFKFSDGSSVNWESVIQGLNAAAGTSGDDTIYGFSYSDLLDGKAGNDFLSGGNESDSYIFGHGYGHDTIRDNMGSLLATNNDVLRFKDASVTDVTFRRTGNSDDLQISINGTDDIVAINGQFTVLYGLFNFIPDQIEHFEFTGGTILSANDVIDRLDSAAGTDGNDIIYGFSYEDTLRGGKGDDVIDGGRENDTYVYGRGDGHDTIIEGADAQTNAFDTLVLHGIVPGAVSLIRSGNDVTLTFADSAPGAADSGSVLLKDELDDFFSRGVERIMFDNGTVWTRNDLRLNLVSLASTSGNDSIVGFNTNDVLRGGLGNDTLSGGPGDDTYRYARGDGNDVIIEGTSGNFSTFDTLFLEGLNPANVSVIRNGNDVTLQIAASSAGAGDAGSILLKDELNDFFSQGVEQIVFADGTVWTQAILRSMLITASGTNGDDVINGSNVSDLIAGGLGNDTINGGPGDDIYLYARGDGNDVIIEGTAGNFSQFDTLKLQDINPAEASLVRNGNDVTILFAATGPGSGNAGSILLKDELDNWFAQGVEQIVFADGTAWTQNDLRLKLLAQAATPGNDVINGYNTNDSITGAGGNDTLSGGAGDDIYVYTRGDGNDSIIEGTAGNFSQFDTLRLHGIALSSVNLVRNGNDVTLGFAETAPGAGNGGSVLLKDELDDWFAQGVEQVVFDDGTVWTQAILRSMLLAQATSAGTGQILGFNVADVIVAGLGDRFMNGRGGADTYIYSSSGGNDVIADPGRFQSTLQLTYIASTEVTLWRSIANSGGNLIIANNVTGKTLTVLGEFSGGGGPLSAINFADGVSWNQAQLTAILSANSGGGYLFGRGDGQVTLSATVGAVLMGPGISASDIYLQSSGTALIVKLKGATDSITVNGDLANNAWGVSSSLALLKFSDGTSLPLGRPSAGNGLPLTFTWLGTNNNYYLVGSGYGSNVFDITAGSGTINFGNSSNGGDGSNTIKFVRGDGVADVNLNGGTGVISFGAGIAVADVYMQANNNGDLAVRIRGASDFISVHNDLSLVSGSVKSAISQLRFSDGSVANLTAPLTFTWLGTNNNYYLTGTNNGSNVFDITAGSGTITFGNASGGGSGLNTIKYLRGDAVADVYLNGGTGVIAFGAGIASSDVYLQSNGNGDVAVRIRDDATDLILIHNDLSVVSGLAKSGISQLQFSDGSITDLTSSLTFTWLGANNNYNLTGSNFGANVFDITAGSGTVTFGNASSGGNGANTIKYLGGDGHLDVYLNGGTGVIQMGSGLLTSDVSLQTNANSDLIVNIAGHASDQIVIHGDFGSANGIPTSGITGIQFGNGTISPLSLDFTAPTVSSVATSGAGITSGNGTFHSGDVVTLTVNFSENVQVNTTGGTPTLTLNDGGSAIYTGGAGTSALTFSHTVAIGQSAPDLAVTALNLNGATIKDGAANAASIAGAAVNPSGTLLIDGSVPTVSSVTTSPASGNVILGGVVTLTVNFSETVAVTTTGGVPTLTLSDGGTAIYTGGTGTNSLTFSHTVGAGHNAADLTVTGLSLNGGTIRDIAGNAANLAGSSVNPSGVLVIDGNAPGVNSVSTSGTGVTSGTGSVNAGKVVILTVNFTENVAVVTTGGTPTLTLSDGGTATYTGGNGTSALTFSHTVAAGQNTPDLTVTALSLNGGTIKDAAGNPAVITGAVSNPSGTLQIDTTASIVSSLVASGAGITSGSGAIGIGSVVTLTVNFNENVNVVTTGGVPTLTLSDGGAATYIGGTGTSSLTFSHTVAAGQSSADLTVTVLSLNGGTITDAAGNTAAVSGANTNPAGILVIDGAVPTVSSVTTSPASGNVILGSVVTLTVNFSESVVVNTTGGMPALALNDGGVATYVSGSGTSALTFSYTVLAGQSTTDLAVTGLSLNGGTIKDAAGNSAVVTGAAVNPAGVLVVDGIVPTVTSVVASGTGITSGAGTLNAGKVIVLTVNFSESVAVVTTGGTPTLTLSDGGTATYTGGTGTGALTFSHTVAAGQNTADLTISALNLNGGTIKDTKGNPADVTGAVTNPVGTLVVDTAGSTISSIVASGTGISAGSGTLNAGKVVSLTANFNETVVVTTTGGTPTLTLNDGGTATYSSGSGTSALVFNYTVAAGQNTTDLAVTALNLNGGTIKDAVGNTAIVTGAVTNPAGGLVIDTTASTVSSVATSGTEIVAGAGSLNAGKVVTLTVNFNENVVVTTTGGTPTLTLNTGTATYTGGSGTSALTFSYTVAAGQNTADLTVTALNLNGGTIKDPAGNTAVVTGAVANPAGTLKIDTTSPTVSSVVASGTGITSGSGTLGVGAVVTLTVNFSESEIVTTTGGTPTLSLNDGGIATYTGGSATTALTFSYTVAAGQNTADLTVTALNLNGGIIKDTAGNAAVVTGAVTNPAGTLKISTPAALAASVATVNSLSAQPNSSSVYTLSSSESAIISPDFSSGTSNEFDVVGNANDENLWFGQSANDLRIDVVGTANHTTISQWFGGDHQASDVFIAGGLRLDNQISQLVQAMATYSSSHLGFDPSASQAHTIPLDPSLQNAIAAAWHA
jgi:Ca2+-binding RTX toxin-like protein